MKQNQAVNVIIENCNSIDYADIQIKQNSLNIKYGHNGLGKSTIAKAIVSQIRQDGGLEALVPFKNRGKSPIDMPKVSGVEQLKSALVFDEDYVNQFVFQQDEVIKNSFDIFIKTKEYLASMAEIEMLTDGIKKEFLSNTEIDKTINDLKDLLDAFGNTKTGAIPKNSKIHKAFGLGNKIENIPASLIPFEAFIKSEEPSKWIAWQIKGNDFSNLDDKCPYCSTALIDESQKSTVLAVSKEYDAKSIDHLNNLKSVIDRLGKYFSDPCRVNLDKVIKAKIELTAQEQGFLTGLRTDIDSLIKKLEGLRAISFFSLRDVESVEDNITGLMIDLTLIDKLDSTETQKVINPINEQLKCLIKKVGELKGTINRHKSRINTAIKNKKESINSFLKSAGYKYTVEIIPEPNSYKMKLVHNDNNEHIKLAANHLSYGEKNAFALVLFMHQVLSENPDLVILDDPISSFDKNKKFAILHQLFKGNASLMGRTTIMLTHDIEPAIDVIKIKIKDMFQGSSPSAAFLIIKSGRVNEITIQRDDIQTFSMICKQNMERLVDPILKSIYLRRHYEIIDSKGLEYNLLASLFKKRVSPTKQSLDGSSNMTVDEKQIAEVDIKKHIPEFDYDDLIMQLNDLEIMKQKFSDSEIGYEKLQLFRLIKGQHENNVITKFINESYHIENEYVMQLNPHKFESVPEYVVNECSRILGFN